jgi:hypothetical protein
MTVKIDRSPPSGYEWPRMKQDKYTHYYLEPQANYDGMTPQFMVMEMAPGIIRILAERCFVADAIRLVDALRLSYSIEMGWASYKWTA